MIELLAKLVWYRGKARIRGIRSGGAPPRDLYDSAIPRHETSPGNRRNRRCLSYLQLTRSPLMLTDLLFLVHCRRSSSSPHSHRSHRGTHLLGRRFRWPNPFLHIHRLGLLPFVKTVRIQSHRRAFSLKLFNCCILRRFLTLTNVQSLEVCNLDIPSFIPTVRQYFGLFLPTLQSLCLRAPKGSNPHLIFFIGLFQRLENLTLSCLRCYGGERERPDPHSSFRSPAARTVDDLSLQEGGFLSGHGSLVWGNQIQCGEPFWR